MVIPSTGKKVSYRPYLVKEEKILLIAFETNDEKEAMKAMVDTIDACVQGNLDTNKLATFDVEYMFTQIRSKSVGETAEINISCSECETKNEVVVKLSEIKCTEPVLSKVIELTENISVEMRYPYFTEMVAGYQNNDKSETEFAYDTIEKCIDAILGNDERYDSADVSKKEMKEFVEQLTSAQFVKLAEWLQDLPKLQEVKEFTCTKCKHVNSHTLEGMQSFF
tara:strand:+ start:22093 stop:22761 length:669 start_codon:yes stop_codon:yes gene_type:complete